MLKVCGIVFILAASWGYGNGLIARLSRHRDNLISCREILDLLAGEIRYGKTPMNEAFLLISDRIGGIAGKILKQIADKIATGRYRSLEAVWIEAFTAAGKDLELTQQELKVILRAGKNLGYLDVQAQVSNLKLYSQQIDSFLEQAEKTAAEKKKLYRSLSMAAGLLVVLLLV